MRLLRWLRAPLLHFLVGGAVLFRVVHGTGSFAAVTGGVALEPIAITAADVLRLREDYTRDSGLAPTPADEAALIDHAIDEELLYREAVARGLDQHDRSVRTWLIEQMAVLKDQPITDEDALYAEARRLGLDRTDLVVRRILVQKMRLLAARANEQPPDDATLRAYYQQHQGDYTPPARLDLWHVFLSTSAHGDATTADAQALLTRFQQQFTAPIDAVRAGETFVVPSHLRGQSPAQLEKLFGPAFVARVTDAPTTTWIGPVPSSFGAHVVWIDAREPGTPPPFDAVQQRVRERWQDERRRARLAALLMELRQRYPLQIESSAWHPRSAS